MARNAVKWPVTASGRRKVVGDVGRSTGDALDRRRGPAAGAPDPGAPTPNTLSVEEFLLRLRCSPLYINRHQSLGRIGVLKIGVLMFLNFVAKLGMSLVGGKAQIFAE